MLKEKMKKIKVLAVDVDGVLTDGKIIFDSAGKETKNFHVHDGFALVLFKRLGLRTAIITARGSKVVGIRAKDLNIDRVYQDAYPKIDAYKKMLKDFKVKNAEVCFIGDDLPDLEVLKRAGFSVAVPDAAAEVKRAVDYVTKRQGGKGAVREVVEMILKAQGKWTDVLARYQ